MSISPGWCWEAEYENSCWVAGGKGGGEQLYWMNDGKEEGGQEVLGNHHPAVVVLQL